MAVAVTEAWSRNVLIPSAATSDGGAGVALTFVAVINAAAVDRPALVLDMF